MSKLNFITTTKRKGSSSWGSASRVNFTVVLATVLMDEVIDAIALIDLNRAVIVE